MTRTLIVTLTVVVAVGTIAGFAGSATAQEGIEQSTTQDASNAAEQNAEVTNGSATLTIDQDASNLVGQTAAGEGDAGSRLVGDQDASNTGIQTATVMDGETVELSISQDASNSAEQGA